MDLHGVVPGFYREDPRCSQRSQGLVDILRALGSGSGLDDLHHGAAAGKLPWKTMGKMRKSIGKLRENGGLLSGFIQHGWKMDENGEVVISCQ